MRHATQNDGRSKEPFVEVKTIEGGATTVAVRFQGNEYLEVPYAADFSASSYHALAGSAMVNKTTSNYGLMGHHDSTDKRLYIETKSFIGVGSTNRNPSDMVKADRRFTFAIVGDNGIAYSKINNVQTSQFQYEASGKSADNILIGGRSFNGSFEVPLYGYMYDAFVFNKNISDSASYNIREAMGLYFAIDPRKPYGLDADGKTLLDLSGNGRHATLENGAYVDPVNGHIVLDSEAGDQYISTNMNIDLNDNRLYAFELWYLTDGPNITNNELQTSLISNYGKNFTEPNTYLFVRNNGVVLIGERNSGGSENETVSNTSYNDGLWHHLVKLTSIDSQKLYIDGTEILSINRPGGIITSGNNIVIGGGTTARYQKCRIGPVRIYVDYVPTSNEIRQRYLAEWSSFTSEFETRPRKPYFEIDPRKAVANASAGANRSNKAKPYGKVGPLLTDLSGTAGTGTSGRNATLENGAYVDPDFGQVVLRPDRVNPPYLSTLMQPNVDSDYAFELWVLIEKEKSVTDASLIKELMTNYSTTSFRYTGLFLEGDHLRLDEQNEQGDCVRTTYDARSYSDGNWHHVVKRVTGSSQELYVDGDLKLTTPRVGGTLTSPDDAFIIGTKPNAGALDWIGLTVKPVAAYAMRRLFGDYGGPQVGIRRSSDDMEENVFFDLYGKVMLVEDVNGGTSRTLEGWLGGATGKVHTWYDQSGNMHHGAGILPPTLINSGSFWSVNFNGTDECFEIPHNEQFNITDSGLSIVSNVMYQDNSNSFIFEKGPVNSQYNIYLNSTEVVFRTTTVNVLRVEFLPVDAPFFTSDTSISTSDTAWNETPLVNGWEASASSFADTGGFIYFPWKGMNGVTESINDAWLPELGTSFPQWLEIKFPVPVLLKSYRITSRNSGSDTRFPSVWRTQGFQGDSWIDLEDADRTESTWDAQVTKVYASGFNHGHTRFARYRLLVKEARKSTSDSTVNEVIIADWNLQVESPQYDVGLVSPKVRLDENTFSPVPNPAFTSNTTVDVTGTAWDNTYQDRDLRIYWRADASTYTTVFLPWKGFNKTVVDVDDCWLSQGIDTVSTSHPQWLSVQYPVAVRVTSYSITSRNDANNTRYPTNWILQGKERSGGWTDLETLERTASSWSASETKSYDNGFLSDRSSYREYRLFITGNSSDDQYVAIGDWTLNVQRVDAASFDNWYGSDVDLDVWYDQGSSKNDIIAFDTIKPTVRFNATKRAYNVTFEVRDGANTNNGSGIVTRRPVSKYVVDSPMYIVHDISINAFPDGGEGDAGYLYSFPTSLIPSPRTDRISTTNSLHKTDNIASSASNFVYAGDIGQRGTHTFAFRGDGDATYYSDQEQIRTSPINNIVGVEAGHWATNNYDWGTIGCELYESYLVPFPRTSPTGPPRSIRQKTAAISTFVLLDGSTPHLANASAFHIRRDVLAAGFSESYLKKLSGPRWIDPAFFSGRSTVRNPIRVYCDMITEGRGMDAHNQIRPRQRHDL